MIITARSVQALLLGSCKQRVHDLKRIGTTYLSTDRPGMAELTKILDDPRVARVRWQLILSDDYSQLVIAERTKTGIAVWSRGECLGATSNVYAEGSPVSEYCVAGPLVYPQ